MMYHNPYFGFPYYRQYSRYGYSYPHTTYPFTKNSTKIPTSFVHTPSSLHKKNISQKPLTPPSHSQSKKEETSSQTEDSPLFQIFGISLYYDDILLVCLIFFLYQEGVKDDGLFMALILLLLS